MQDKQLVCSLTQTVAGPEHHKISRVHLVGPKKMMYLSFKDSNLVGIIKFDFTNLIKAVRQFDLSEESKWLHDLTADRVTAVHASESDYIVLEHNTENKN